MALIWFDGFETYNSTADMTALSRIPYSAVAGWSDSYGRRSSRGIYTVNGNGWRINIPEQPATIIVGQAVYLNQTTTPSYNSNAPLVELEDSSGGTIHLKFHVKSDRNIEVRDGANSLLATSSGMTMEVYTWYYLEIKATISNTVGQVTINMNSTEILNTAASLDTQNGSNAYVGGIEVKNVWNVATWHDDLYICDTSGSINNDFLGDIRVDVVYPNEAGAHTDFTPSAGSNYENVDEQYPDDDTTYNDSVNTSPGDQDTYGMESLEVIGSTIHGVKDQITIRKTDSGLREAKMITRQSGTDYLGATIIASDSYTTNVRVMETNPADSAAFQESDVNSGEVGVEVVT